MDVNYDRFPHALVASASKWFSLGLYDNISFLSNPAPAVAASRYLMYSGYILILISGNYSNLRRLGSGRVAVFI